MNEYITQEDYDSLENYVINLEKQVTNESKKLAEAASHGGSVPAFMPEYQTIEAKVHSLQDEASSMKKRLHDFELVAKEDIPTDIITNYKLVVLKNISDGRLVEMYIIDPEIIKSKNINTTHKIATPKSPIAKQLFGKKENDHVVIDLPEGQIEYLIISFSNLFL